MGSNPTASALITKVNNAYMRIYIWEEGSLGGASTIVVYAYTVDTARQIVRTHPDYNKIFGEYLIKSEPRVVELDQAKLVTYFDYYE